VIARGSNSTFTVHCHNCGAIALTCHLPDKGYLFFNKCYTPIYLYHSIRFLWYCPNVLWSAETIAPLANVVIPFCAFFVIQDGFYTVFHWLLHKPALYPYIHKHHHRLRSCYKGLDDGQNTHPIEHFVGEYLFLWTWFLYTRLFPVHVFGVLLYMTASGVSTRGLFMTWPVHLWLQAFSRP